MEQITQKMKEILNITYFKLELGNMIKPLKEKLYSFGRKVGNSSEWRGPSSMCICLKLGWLVPLDAYVDINKNQSPISLLTVSSTTMRENYYYSIFSV